MKHIKGLDTLRAFAVFCVIVRHWGPEFTKSHPVGRFIQTFFIPGGAAGVYLFFTLSGFLITSILLDAKENSDKGARISIVKNFFARRILRIFPIYYLMVFILLIVYPASIKNELSYLLTYTLNFPLYSRNVFFSFFSHSWTLDVEEQFYLFWPWLIMFVNSKYLKYVFMGALVTGIISSYISLQANSRIEPFLMFDCIDAFGIGGLYAYARMEKVRCRKFEKMIRFLVPFSLLLYIYWAIASYMHQPGYWLFLEKTVDSILSLWPIIIAVNNKSKLAAKYLWGNRFFNFIGRISYGIYVFHPYFVTISGSLILFLTEKVFHSSAWQKNFSYYYFLYIVGSALLILTCWLSYILIETPILRLKKYFKYTD